jgi:hypothetical protein
MSGDFVCEVHGRSENCPKHPQVYCNCQSCDEAICAIHSFSNGSRVDMGSVIGLAPSRPTDQAGYSLYSSLVQRERLPKSHGDELGFPRDIEDQRQAQSNGWHNVRYDCRYREEAQIARVG